MITYLLLVLAAIITASGQLLMKKGSQLLQGTLVAPGQHQFAQDIIKKIFAIVLEPHVLIAFSLYFLGSILWLKILTRGDLGRLYPVLIGMTIIFTSAASAVLFRETFTFTKTAGIIFILLGVTMLMNFGFRQN
ncbi:MAG: hypothetical protein A2122_02755 [Candidatus Liptonbacteria bacterium GWB1_49_6]|uniref:EamA domain-containing protein n=1 Tax=Candidatus Liptonbacteria bacterium GWB1_49_6 TaxID=1798644 RepID=A0A1G2C6U5_9BACT|nr:MAG: hypothetical protein A2122_02755 [Candidatus Liptonbacteria bacterium GWB1_49_6]